MQDWNDEPVLHGHRVKAFRYRIVYYVSDEQVRIIAYAHERRRPGYWEHRIER